MDKLVNKKGWECSSTSMKEKNELGIDGILGEGDDDQYVHYCFNPENPKRVECQ
jgi:hypothetical protein